jgi:GT2 family glycosyltransferase
MKPAPLVTVIVLNFNGEQILARCLDHLLAQTYPRIQLLVVDNASSDGSEDILRRYETGGRVTALRSLQNLGCAGGRNFGLRAAEGDVIAFMDNDGYASPEWLAEAMRLLDEEPEVGAVAPLVFFNRHKLILNGTGGTLNQRGYGGDYCFKEPFEFAQLPDQVLYPMGCGMVVRRTVLDAMGGFDEALFNYYDDVEVGVWTWRLGLQVQCAPLAWVDHDFSASDAINRNKVLLCERNRVRTVLKYFPAGHLPGWLAREVLSLVPRPSPVGWTLPYRVWAWNLRHLGSALRLRRRYGADADAFRHLLYPGWGSFPPPRPNNQLNAPNSQSAATAVVFDEGADDGRLNYGWYAPERERNGAMRWTSGMASLFVRVPENCDGLEITWRGGRGDQQTALRLRRLGELEPVWHATEALATDWTTRHFECNAAAGIYELQLITAPVFGDSGSRELGVAVARLAFV